ncbi:Venom allergen 5, partial [Gryllus bimaculatus]
MRSLEKVVATSCASYTSGKPPGPCKLRSLSKDDKVALLSKQNELRARAARGEDTQPQASDMMRLCWDMELECVTVRACVGEAVAARWVLQCKDSYDKCRDSTRFPVGQNIAWRRLDMDIPMDLITMLQSWYNEIMDFSKDGIKSYKFNPSTAHYTQVTLRVMGVWGGACLQLVWAKTTLVGCALAERGSAPGIEFTLICNFGPSGNVAGEPVYQEGDAASACPKGSTPDK